MLKYNYIPSILTLSRISVLAFIKIKKNLTFKEIYTTRVYVLERDNNITLNQTLKQNTKHLREILFRKVEIFTEQPEPIQLAPFSNY